MNENSNSPILWYFADPMCSWCWGFSPVISQVKASYASQLRIAMVMGGLQPGETQALSVTSRDEILQHWHQVEKTTGQTISFKNALPDGFIYNTEPACRAVITVARMDHAKTFEYFTSVQAAFYRKNQDVTQPAVLKQLAEASALDGDEFETLYTGEEQVANTQKNFQFSRRAGVQGFPTLILNLHDTLHVLTRGFQDYETLSTALNKLLAH